MFTIIFVSILIFGFITLIILLILTYMLERSKGRLYLLFLEIPSECLKILYGRSEFFVSSFNFKNSDDLTSVIDDDFDEDSQTASLRQTDNFSKCIFKIEYLN